MAPYPPSVTDEDTSIPETLHMKLPDSGTMSRSSNCQKQNWPHKGPLWNSNTEFYIEFSTATAKVRKWTRACKYPNEEFKT